MDGLDLQQRKKMKITTAIFDMDGLLIDSEPLWYEAALECLAAFNVSMSNEEYVETTGLRTKEFLQHWFTVYGIDHAKIPEMDTEITNRVIKKVNEKGTMMDGALEAVALAGKLGLKIGLASSSPMSLIEAVVKKSGLTGSFQALNSAEGLRFGKPNPQVFIDCADALNSHPVECICFEDSFNGLIAAKAARMKCIVVPHHEHADQDRWNIADLKLVSLKHLDEQQLGQLI